MASQGRGHFPISYVGFRGSYRSQPLAFVQGVPTGNPDPLTEFFFDAAPAAVSALEEDTPGQPSGGWTAGVLTSAQFAGTEEVIGAAAAAFEETSSWAPASPARTRAPATSGFDESFVAIAALDEDSMPSIAAPHDIYTLTITGGEGFIGDPLIEDSPPVNIVQNDTWAAVPIFSTEEIAAPKLAEDASYPFVFSPEPSLTIAALDDEFVSPKLVEDAPPTITITWQEDSARFVTNEDFAGVHPIEENVPFLPSRHDAATLYIVPSDEAFRTPAPPPPPPPVPVGPPRPRPHVRGGIGGGHQRIEFDWELFWRQCEETSRDEERRRRERQERPQDYALLPLVGGEMVTAIEDGCVDTFLDEKGNTITRLVATSGVTYYYAKLRNVRPGFVRKGDTIGITDEVNLAPRALPPKPAPAETPTTRVENAPKLPPQPVFGVMPVSSPPAPSPPAPAPLPAPQPVLARRTSTSTVFVVGAIVVALALGVAVILKSMRDPPPKRKKKRKRRRRR